MSTLSVTTINTANGTTDLTVTSGNTVGGKVIVSSGGGVFLQGNSGANAIVIATNNAVTFSNTVNITGATTFSNTVNITGAATFSNTVNITGDTTVAGNFSMASSFKRNRIINGNCAVDQRNAGAAQTITAGAALTYTVDRFYAYCTGANVTGQQVAGATANQYRYQFTGAASVTAINFAQRIEALNCADLAGTTATFSVDMANSLLTTVTWTAYYANTTNTFGTLASPTVTSISTGTFTVSSTVTRYNVQIAIPSAATTGLQIVLSVGAQTSGTWTIGNVQLEAGSIATPYERQIYSDQLAQCQRYYQAGKFGQGGYILSSTAMFYQQSFAVEMRTAPSMATSSVSSTNLNTLALNPYSGQFQIYGVGASTAGAYYYGNFTATAEL